MSRIKDEVRERIIEAARHVFSKYGFKKATLDDIANAAFKGKSSIYYYFNDKEEIFKAVVEKEAAMLRAEILAAMENESSAFNKLKTYIITRFYTFRKVANFYIAVKDDLLTRLPFIETLRVAYDLEEKNMVKLILEQGKKEGVFKNIDSQKCANAVVMAMKGFEYPLVAGSETNSDEDISNFINLIFYGICN